MRGFLYILQKHDQELLKDEFIKSTINHHKDVNHNFNVIGKNNLKIYEYNNEGIEDEYVGTVNKHITCIGQFVKNESDIKSEILKLDESNLLRYISKIRGAFGIGLADFNKNSMSFFTHIFRIDNIFYRETDNGIFIGTDPLIVSVLSSKNCKPEIDISNSVSFLMNGYFADETTLFKDVKLIPPNNAMYVNNNGVNFEPVDNTITEMFTQKPKKKVNDLIKENYIEAFKVVPKNSNINIGITGGKDSRLALLGLLEAGYNVNTNTRGFLDNPDVKMAEELTKKLGLTHRIIEPKILSSKGMNVNLEKKALQAMVATSGQVYGYENIKYQPEYKGNIGVTGVAALTMKGGYTNLNNLSPKNPYQEMLKRFLPMEELLIEGKAEKYKKTLKNLVTSDFQSAQYKHALFYRNGRWTSGTRLAKSYSSDMYSPYYDNVFTKSIMRIQKQYLDNGFAQYTLMNKLNSPISLMPLVGSRWGFEKNKPVKPENYTGWLNRTPMYPTTKLANYNWRNLTLPDNTIIREEFKNILLRDSNHPIYEVVDFSKLKNLFESKLTSKHLKFMWSLLSLYSYINYLNGEPVKSKDLTIRIPETIVNEVRSTPVTFDLTYDIFSTNKGIEVINSDKKVTVISNSSHQNNKNKYLTIFNNNISNAVRNKKTLLNKRKEIAFNMHLSYSEKLSLRYCLIFFDSNNKRIEAKWFSNTINKNIKNLDGSSKVPENAESYKIAVKFPNDFAGELNVDYFFSIIQ